MLNIWPGQGWSMSFRKRQECVMRADEACVAHQTVPFDAGSVLKFAATVITDTHAVTIMIV